LETLALLALVAFWTFKEASSCLRSSSCFSKSALDLVRSS
jgi:hypothetical protein